MALDTYSGLQTSVASYLNREDLTTQIPDFITLAEAKFNRELRRPEMIERATGTANDQYVGVPSDFLQVYALDLVPGGSQRIPLRYVGVLESESEKAQLLSGVARFYTLIGTTIEIIPAPSEYTDYELKYYQQVPALSDDTTSNWLLVKSPDLYLYSTLLEATPYLNEDERLPVWAAARQKIMDDMALEGERAMRPATQLTMKRRAF